MADKQRLEKLKKLLEITNEGLTRDEFLQSFKKITNHILKLEIKLVEKVDQVNKDLISDQTKLKGKTKEEIEVIKKELLIEADKMFEEQKQNLDFIRDKVRRIKEGVDGKDGVDGVNGIGIQGEPGRDSDAGQIAKDVVKLLNFKNTLTEMKEEFTEEIGKIRRLGGGGTSAIGVAQAFKWIAHTEAPVGLINGSNTIYTVETNIWWIAGFTLNGEQIAELPNFTFVGKKITFSTALPAAYSGKDFEIKYIGT